MRILLPCWPTALRHKSGREPPSREQTSHPPGHPRHDHRVIPTPWCAKRHTGQHTSESIAILATCKGNYPSRRRATAADSGGGRASASAQDNNAKADTPPRTAPVVQYAREDDMCHHEHGPKHPCAAASAPNDNTMSCQVLRIYASHIGSRIIVAQPDPFG